MNSNIFLYKKHLFEYLITDHHFNLMVFHKTLADWRKRNWLEYQTNQFNNLSVAVKRSCQIPHPAHFTFTISVCGQRSASSRSEIRDRILPPKPWLTPDPKHISTTFLDICQMGKQREGYLKCNYRVFTAIFIVALGQAEKHYVLDETERTEERERSGEKQQQLLLLWMHFHLFGAADSVLMFQYPAASSVDAFLTHSLSRNLIIFMLSTDCYC